MRSISSGGKKQGVSLCRNCTGSPQRCSRMPRKRRYFSGDHRSLNRRRYEGIKEKCSRTHDLQAVDPDIESAADHVDVGGGIPVGAGVRAIGIAKGDVDAWNLLVLKDIADNVPNGDIRADGELADTVAVLVRMAVTPEVVFKLTIGRMRLDKAAVANFERQRRGSEVAVLLAQIVADNTVDNKRSVHIERRGEGFAPRQVPPLIRADKAAGFNPFEARREIGDQ